MLFLIVRISNSQFKCEYLKNEKPFLNFFPHVRDLHQIFNILEKNMMVIANVFPKLQTLNNFVAPLCKKRRFGTPLDSEHVKASRIIAKSP